MPVDNAPVPAGGTPVRLDLSAAVELFWVGVNCKRDTVAGPPEELIRRADAFWGDEMSVDAELLIAAQALGCLTGPDLSPLVALESATIATPSSLDLRTESPEIRDKLIRRVERLRREKATRRRYSELLRELWSFAEPSWDEAGQAAAERSLRRIQAALDHGQAPLEVIPPSHIARRDTMIGLTEEAIRGGTLLFAPSYFAGERGFTIALPGVLVVSIGAGVSQDIAHRRIEVERVARGLKLLSDPTRLLILTELERSPASVGEVARRVAVSQPTASVHLKQLREAGLVAPVPGKGSAVYRVQTERVSSMLDEARAVSLRTVADAN